MKKSNDEYSSDILENRKDKNSEIEIKEASNFNQLKLQKPDYMKQRLQKLKTINIELNGYLIIHEIGHGSHGAVYIANEKTTNNLVAIKKISLLRNDCIKNEIKANKKLQKNNHIVKMLKYFHTELFMYIVFEYSEFGDLFTYLMNKRSVTELNFIKIVIKDVCQGLKYCHENRICHRDIKPENILLFFENDDVIFKLCDFGLAKCTTNVLKCISGTDSYIAPEVCQGEKYYCSMTDMWAVGILTYYLYNFNIPFNTRRFGDQSMEEITKNVSKIKEIDIKDFILNCLKLKPKERMTADQALKHIFLNSF